MTFALLNPNTRTCPVFRTNRDAEITRSIYRRVTPFVRDDGSDGNPWEVSFQLMFMMNTDSHLFRTREELEEAGHILQGNHFVISTGINDPPAVPAMMTGVRVARDVLAVIQEQTADERPAGSARLERTSAGSQPPTDTTRAQSATSDQVDFSTHAHYLPLYEGKMVHQFDHRWATYSNGRFRDVSSDEKQDPTYLPLPRYWVPAREVHERVADCRSWMQGWRDIARRTDERTLILATHPYLAAGNKLPQIISLKSAAQTRLGVLSAIMNSFACDYAARQKVGGTNVNFFIAKQIPIFDHVRKELERWIGSRILELSFSAWDMAPFASDLGYRGPPFRWDDNRRPLLRAELDALMFHLYGINRADTVYIMGTFPIVQRKDDMNYGEYRTKHLILARYDAMTQAYDVTHGSLKETPNGEDPPVNYRALATYSGRLAEALFSNYRTNIEPPPADPSCTHPESTRPSWAT